MKTFIFFGTLFFACNAAKWNTPAYQLREDGCRKNEVRVPCDYNCEEQCGFVPTVCSIECRPNACVCEDGFVRNTNNECVHRLECTAETSRCPEFEHFEKCGSVCEPTCDEPTVSSCPYHRCVRSVCRCNPGYFRDGDVCLSREECKRHKKRPLEIFTL